MTDFRDMQFASALDFSRVSRNVRCWRSSLQRVDINTQVQKNVPFGRAYCVCGKARHQVCQAAAPIESRSIAVMCCSINKCLPSNFLQCLNSATCVQRERQHVAKNSTHTSISIWGGFSAGVIFADGNTISCTDAGICWWTSRPSSTSNTTNAGARAITGSLGWP